VSSASPLKTSTSFSVDGILSKTSPIPSSKIVTDVPTASACSPFAALSQDAKWAQTMASSFPWLSAAANLSPPPSKYTQSLISLAYTNLSQETILQHQTTSSAQSRFGWENICRKSDCSN
jgi:hypothetical protein